MSPVLARILDPRHLRGAIGQSFGRGFGLWEGDGHRGRTALSIYWFTDEAPPILQSRSRTPYRHASG